LKNGLPPPDAEVVMAAADDGQLNDATVTPPREPLMAKPAPEPATETAQTQPDRQETPPAAAEEPEPMTRKHTVSPGESLWSIAYRYYGSGADYERIFEANREIVRRSDLIHPGQVLAIPEAE
jgi:nucleoid-associated protein YgaU